MTNVRLKVAKNSIQPAKLSNNKQNQVLTHIYSDISDPLKLQ